MRNRQFRSQFTPSYPLPTLVARLTIYLHYSSIYDVIVDFKIGETRQGFGIHRGLLCQASSKFRERLLKSETVEEGIVAQVIELKKEDPQIFGLFHTWLYSQKITLESKSCKDLPWRVIISLYSFADRIGVPRLQNACIDTAIRKRRDGGLFPNQTDVNTLWKIPGKVFQLRRLLLDLFAAECNLGNAMASNKSYHPHFLQGLVQVLYEMKMKTIIYEEVDFWKKRKEYYVIGNNDPIVID